METVQNTKNVMNYEAIKTRIKALIEDAQRKPRGRVEAALEPIRESLSEARRQGVRLRDLYDVVKAETKDISPGSFAKYAQRHLQMKRRKGKPLIKPVPPSSQQKIAPRKQAPESPKTSTGKPRIATGDY